MAAEGYGEEDCDVCYAAHPEAPTNETVLECAHCEASIEE